MHRVSNPSTFVSFAQNREDVVLWRALKGVAEGRYVDIGANHPTVDSVSRAFYDRGWHGIAVEPVPALATTFATERPRDVVVQAAVTDADVEAVTLHAIADTGLSSIVDEVGATHRGTGFEVQDLQVPAVRLDRLVAEQGWEGQEVHFLSVDVEGAEDAVLRSADFTRWRPWVVVVESTAPRDVRQTHDRWEHILTDAGYQFCLFDGLSRFYVSGDHLDLLHDLSYPACPHDVFETMTQQNDRGLIDELRQDLERQRDVAATLTRRLEERTADLTALAVRWRTAALSRWADSTMVNHDHRADLHRIDALQRELDATRHTVSWRVTAPLRVARRLTRP